MLLRYFLMLLICGLTAKSTSEDRVGRHSNLFAVKNNNNTLLSSFRHDIEQPGNSNSLYSNNNNNNNNNNNHQIGYHHVSQKYNNHHLYDDANANLSNYEMPQPHFENSTDRMVMAAIGTSAHLHCRVRSLGDRAVSWIRKRDLHILTIGIMTYTNDQRFVARHVDASDEWILKIVSVQPRDAGIYECQVSTEPKISLAYKLTVVTSKAQILANRELFIRSGSDINLTCVAPQAPGPFTHIFWLKDSELVNDLPRGGIRVISEQQSKMSNLVISRVLHTDSGNYTCAADNSNPDSVFVHIIKSEQHAAMQHELASCLQPPKLFLLLMLMFAFNQVIFLNDKYGNGVG